MQPARRNYFSIRNILSFIGILLLISASIIAILINKQPTESLIHAAEFASIEAANGVLTGNAMIMPDTTANNGKAVQFGKINAAIPVVPLTTATNTNTCPSLPLTTGTVTLPLTVNKTDTYTLFTRMRLDGTIATQNQTVYLQIDNNCPLLIGGMLSTNSWNWLTKVNDKPVQVVLTAKQPHVIRLIGATLGEKIDRLIFLSSQNQTCIPTGLGDNCNTIAPTDSRHPGKAGSLDRISSQDSIASLQNDNDATPSASSLFLMVSLNGLDTTLPTNQSRPVTVTFTNATPQSGQATLPHSMTGTLLYDATRKGYTSLLDVSALPKGSYTVKISVQKYVDQTLPTSVLLNGTGITNLPPVVLLAGDFNSDGILDIQDFNLMMHCYASTNAHVCSPQQAKAVDLTGDGIVNGLDYNLFLTEFATQNKIPLVVTK